MSTIDPQPASPGLATQILNAIAVGRSGASDDLLPVVYAELRTLARSRLANQPPGQTLQATALVHEAYLRLLSGAEGGGVRWDNRAHFFGAAARAMRDIVVEIARRKAAIKHGGGRARVGLEVDVPADEPSAAPISDDGVDILALDDALRLLAAEDQRKCEVVMLRYFSGLSIEETAVALGIAPATVKRDWAYSKAWLMDRMSFRADGAARDSER